MISRIICVKMRNCRIIEGDGEIVGFSTIACDPASETDYWIDDIMIDRRFQGRGHGRAAMLEALRAITKRYPQCSGMRTCFGQTRSRPSSISVLDSFRPVHWTTSSASRRTS